MILSTTSTIEGFPAKEYYGVVTAQTILGANIFKDLFAGLRDIVGGRSRTYEKVIEEAKEQALHELKIRAAELGANAVVAIDLDIETVGAQGSMLMVMVTGTAIKI
jgi:uncharacterized protein YbjQ (UPF0145 family)